MLNLPAPHGAFNAHLPKKHQHLPKKHQHLLNGVYAQPEAMIVLLSQMSQLSKRAPPVLALRQHQPGIWTNSLLVDRTTGWKQKRNLNHAFRPWRKTYAIRDIRGWFMLLRMCLNTKARPRLG
jgi:hypothetical protein